MRRSGRERRSRRANTLSEYLLESSQAIGYTRSALRSLLLELQQNLMPGSRTPLMVEQCWGWDCLRKRPLKQFQAEDALSRQYQKHKHVNIPILVNLDGPTITGTLLRPHILEDPSDTNCQPDLPLKKPRLLPSTLDSAETRASSTTPAPNPRLRPPQ